MPTSIEVLGPDLLHQVTRFLRVAPGEKLYPKGDGPLLNFSQTNKQLREISSTILFKKITVEHSSWVDGNTWQTCIENLQRLRDSQQSVLQYTKEIQINFYLTLHAGLERGSVPLEVADLLNQILQKPRRLQVVILNISALNTSELFKTDATIALPDVERLSLSPHCHNFIARCPNLVAVTLHLGHNPTKLREVMEMDFLKASLASETLRELDYAQTWTSEMINFLISTPNSIRVLGTIPAEEIDFRFVPLAKTLTPLSKLPHLTTLKLAEASSLDLGFHPPWCGNAYDSPGGDEVWEAVQREERLAEWKAIGIVKEVFNGHEKLEKCYVGRAVFVRKQVDRWVRLRDDGVEEDELESREGESVVPENE